MNLLNVQDVVRLSLLATVLMKSKDFPIYLKSNAKIFHINGEKPCSPVKRFQNRIAV